MQCSEKKRLEELLESETSKLRELTSDYLAEDVSVRQMERGYLKLALGICLSLLKFVISVKITEKMGKRVVKLPGEILKSSGLRPKVYLSLFGLLEFHRPAYHSNQRGMIYVLDEDLDIPTQMWSYNIQELVGSSASTVAFEESVKMLNELLDLNLSATGSERNVAYLGAQVDEYYEQKQVNIPEGLVHFSASFDGKGVPMIRPCESGKVKEINSNKRLNQGEKRGIKKMATLGVMSWFKPRERTVETVIEGLTKYHTTKKDKRVKYKSEESEAKDGKAVVTKLPKNINDNRWHQDIHCRGFLGDQDKAIEYGIAHIKSMIRHPQSRFVVPIDAGIGLEDKVLQYVEQYGLGEHFDGIILDIIHVSEYVWTCANAIFPKGADSRADWVKRVLEDLLYSRTDKVIEDLQKIIDKGNLSKTKIEAIQTAVTYFTNHQHKMDYKTFIDKGYPVSSALVESHCGHLVSDRMEHSGMRWSEHGAQNMLNIRAAKLNGDLPNFISFTSRQYEKQEMKIAA